MVRRGSTVRVRQRASKMPRKAGLSLLPRLAEQSGCSGMEHFLELSDLDPLTSPNARSDSGTEACHSYESPTTPLTSLLSRRTYGLGVTSLSARQKYGPREATHPPDGARPG